MSLKIIIIVMILVLLLFFGYLGHLQKKYPAKENQILYFILLGLFALIFFLDKITKENNNINVYTVSLLVFFATYIYFFIFLKKKWDAEKHKDWKKNQIALNKRDESLKELMGLVSDGFILKNCNNCNDNQYTLVEFNSMGTGVRMACSSCSSKKWFKSKPEFDRGKDILGLWNLLTYLNEDVIDDKQNFFFNIIQDEEESTKLDNRSRKHIPQQVKDKVWNRDQGKCVECGSNEKLEFDHIIPHSKGGADTYRNIQLLCEPCNRSKSAKIG